MALNKKSGCAGLDPQIRDHVARSGSTVADPFNRHCTAGASARVGCA